MKVVHGRRVYTTLAEIVSPGHTALVIVDMQNDFMSPGGASHRAGRIDPAIFRPLIERHKEIIGGARQAGVPVIYIQNTVHPGYANVSGAWLRYWERIGFPEGGEPTIDGTWGHQIVGELAPQPGDIIVSKCRSSAFVGTNLDLVLRSNGIESVVVTGMATHVCVESTARDAAFFDYYVVVPRDCVYAGSPELHDASLKLMAYRFDVVNSCEVLGAWPPRGSPPANA